MTFVADEKSDRSKIYKPRRGERTLTEGGTLGGNMMAAAFLVIPSSPVLFKYLLPPLESSSIMHRTPKYRSCFSL
jgi:hypothetical protein